MPTRMRGVELMDDPGARPELVVRSLEDVVQANRWFGGTRAVLQSVRGVIEAAEGSRISLLDVGAGLGDVCSILGEEARRRGIEFDAVLVDLCTEALAARTCVQAAAVSADAFSLPFSSGSFDIVVCSQLAHHFEGEQLRRLVVELDRVGRRRVVLSDLRRSRLAAAGIWLASWPLRFHPVSRHDAVLSVLRGFTAAELGSLVHRSTGVEPAVSHRAGFRVTASWQPSGAQHAT